MWPQTKKDPIFVCICKRKTRNGLRVTTIIFINSSTRHGCTQHMCMWLLSLSLSLASRHQSQCVGVTASGDQDLLYMEIRHTHTWTDHTPCTQEITHTCIHFKRLGWLRSLLPFSSLLLTFNLHFFTLVVNFSLTVFRHSHFDFSHILLDLCCLSVSVFPTWFAPTWTQTSNKVGFTNFCLDYILFDNPTYHICCPLRLCCMSTVYSGGLWIVLLGCKWE